MKRIILSLFLVIILTSLVSSLNEQKCGDSYCNAGNYNLNGNEIEDASTCFQDCAYTDYTFCDIDLTNGGTCTFRGIDYKISNLVTNGCSIDQTASFNVAFTGHSREFKGVVSQNYVQLADNADIMISTAPCSAYQTKNRIYLRAAINPSELNDFYKVENINLNLMKDKQINLKFTLKSNVSQPYCKLELKNADTQESVTSTNGLGCNSNWDISLDSPSFTPGKYTFIGQILDKNAQNKLGEKTLQIKINGCLEDNECINHNLFSYGLCQGNDVKTCAYKLNYAVISVIAVILLLAIGIITYFVRKRN